MNELGTDFLNTIKKSQVVSQFAHLLESIYSPLDVVTLIHRYSLFAGKFAGGAATLAGAFHLRQDLFKDRDEKIQACADRGAEIAACIFAAVEDEYIDRHTFERITHRNLSQRTVKEAAVFYNIRPERFDLEIPLSFEMLQILNDVWAGFRINNLKTEADLFFALGFHVANEIFAENEFQLINSFLIAHCPKLVDHLNAAKAYGWIESHTLVEADHVHCGLMAIDLATRYYVGPEPLKDLIDRIFEGLAFAIALELRVYDNIEPKLISR